jgi:hypothetical protein
VTNDRWGDFDARRVGWWQRRSAVRSIRRAAGITPADRELRIQSAKAAQTRGELHVLTRDLAGQAPAVLSPSVPPAYSPPAYSPPAYSAPSYDASTHPQASHPPVTPPRQPGMPQPPTPKKSPGRSLVLGLVVVVLLIGSSVVSCISSIVDTVDKASSSGSESSSPTELQTVGGWTQMVGDLRGELRAGQATGIVVRRTAATIATVDPDDPDQELRFYYDGDVTQSSPTQRTPGTELFDLTAIAPAVVAEAVAGARSRSGATSSSEAWVTILDAGDGPRISVSFPDGTVGGYELVVDVDGNEISQTL